jgi:hypothetical protein
LPDYGLISHSLTAYRRQAVLLRREGIFCGISLHFLQENAIFLIRPSDFEPLPSRPADLHAPARFGGGVNAGSSGDL